MRLFYFSVVVFLLPAINCCGQDYFSYQRIFNNIDEDILNLQPEAALNRLDTIYKQYDFIYAHHCIKALEICGSANDSIRAAAWLQKAFVQGVPMWMIRNNNLTRSLLAYRNVRTVADNYLILRKQYYDSINDSLAKVIDSLLETDQQLTSKVNEGFILSRALNDVFRWKVNNKKSFIVINEIILHYNFPGERLIGLPENLQDSAKAIKYYKKYGAGTVKDHRAYTMLIHYFSDKRAHIDSSLYYSVKSGYLPPYQYGALNDFRSRYGKAGNYYNVWHTDKDKNNAEEISIRRKNIGLNSYEQQQRNRQLNLERIKSGTVNDTIKLE